MIDGSDKRNRRWWLEFKIPHFIEKCNNAQVSGHPLLTEKQRQSYLISGIKTQLDLTIHVGNKTFSLLRQLLQLPESFKFLLSAANN